MFVCPPFQRPNRPSLRSSRSLPAHGAVCGRPAGAPRRAAAGQAQAQVLGLTTYSSDVWQYGCATDPYCPGEGCVSHVADPKQPCPACQAAATGMVGISKCDQARSAPPAKLPTAQRRRRNAAATLPACPQSNRRDHCFHPRNTCRSRFGAPYGRVGAAGRPGLPGAARLPAAVALRSRSPPAARAAPCPGLKRAAPALCAELERACRALQRQHCLRLTGGWAPQVAPKKPSSLPFPPHLSAGG